VVVQTAPAAQGTQPARLADTGALQMDNVSLVEMINLIGRMLKINFILDPRVRGSVTIHTYGEIRPTDLMPLLETILRVNAATIVRVGDLYRVIPINAVSQLPLEPQVNLDPKSLPDDERMVLNLIFLKYATATEIEKLIQPFLGEGATHSVYEPANLLILEDNSRSMRRTMELIALFDSDGFAGQRVKLFEVTNSRPSDLVRDLDSVFKAYALSERTSAVKFLPVDRINTLIAVAPNPGIFVQVQSWIDKLDVPVKITAGTTNNWVYRLKYGRAETVAMAIMALYSGNPMALIGLAAFANSSMYASGMGLNGTGNGMGMGMGSPYGGGGYMGGMNNPYMGGMGYGGMYGGYGGGMYGGGMPGYGAYANPTANYTNPYAAAAPQAPGTLPAGAAPAVDQTGQYLTPTAAAAAGVPSAAAMMQRMPHVIPNPFDNTLLVQGTPQEWEQIRSLLLQLDVPPRQVLIEARIYEVDITNNLNGGVESLLESRNVSGTPGSSSGSSPASRTFTAAAGAAGLVLSGGALVLRSHQLLALLNTSELRGRSKIISAPSVIATDSIPATMNVGDQIPVLTSQAVAAGAQSGGSSLFTQTISNQSSGVTLSIMAHVNSSGVVTMIINQQVSSPQAPASGAAIQSDSFSNRSVSTQVTVQDGDTVAIGGMITEEHIESSSGVPFLHRIPVVGLAFGAKTTSTKRSELIIFFTPRVIYDTTQVADASEEIKDSVKHLMKEVNER
jgi:general secretion pathway protein D